MVRPQKKEKNEKRQWPVKRALGNTPTCRACAPSLAKTLQKGGLIKTEQPQWKAKEWHATVRERIGACVWGPTAVVRPLGVSISCAGLGPVLTQEHFVPPGMVYVLCIADSSFASPTLGRSAVNFVRQNCKAKHLFAYIAIPALGKGHCEMEHKVVDMPPAADEDLFVAAFHATPFLNRSASSKHNCFNDPRAVPFKEQRRHIHTRCPAVALLVISDYEELPKRSRRDVLSFVLYGKPPSDPQRETGRVDWLGSMCRLIEEHGLYPYGRRSRPVQGMNAGCIRLSALFGRCSSVLLCGQRRLLPRRVLDGNAAAVAHVTSKPAPIEGGVSAMWNISQKPYAKMTT